MKKFLYNDQEYWVGHHPTLGILIYDPKVQTDIGPDRVRLFKVDYGQSGTFIKETIREKLVPFDEQYLPSMEKAVSEYIKNMNDLILKKERLDLRKRETHCYSCKRALSSEYDSKCEECGWMKCGTCDACGCKFLM